jgi:hypothetical protein
MRSIYAPPLSTYCSPPLSLLARRAGQRAGGRGAPPSQHALHWAAGGRRVATRRRPPRQTQPHYARTKRSHNTRTRHIKTAATRRHNGCVRRTHGTRWAPHRSELPYITLYYITLHYITFHYITIDYISFHFISLHYIITFHYQVGAARHPLGASRRLRGRRVPLGGRQVHLRRPPRDGRSQHGMSWFVCQAPTCKS